jgi:hypothetical protein
VNREMDEINRLKRQLEAMPEWDRVWSVREFESTVLIFRANAAEALTFLRNRELQDTKRDPLETAAFRDLQQELARLVHNFVAAAATLVDHARQFFTERYGQTDLFALYDQEVERRFRTGGLHNFVKGLRNFILHRRFPAITSMRTWAEGKPILHMHFWQKSDLLTWSRWTPEARVFLERSVDQINIQNVLSDYEVLVGSFYDWVFEMLKSFHQNDERLVADRLQQIDELAQAAATS